MSITIEAASAAWLDQLEHRKRRPIKAATLRMFRSHLDCHILPTLGQNEISNVSVAVFREFVSTLDRKGFPAAAVIEAVQRNRVALKKPFYSIPDLARRWCMSRAGVYNVLREHEVRIVDFSQKGKSKGKKVVYADAVDRIERQRTRTIDVAA